MVDYAETFVVGGETFGIEDYDAQGQHFMPDMPHKRFKLWSRGCGIGGDTDSLAEAREYLFKYISRRMSAKLKDHANKAEYYESIVSELGNDVFNLARYKESK